MNKQLYNFLLKQSLVTSNVFITASYIHVHVNTLIYPLDSQYKYAPKFSASTAAASLPLGSISPYSRSSTDIQNLGQRSADVPATLAAATDILKYVNCLLILYLRHSLTAVSKVIIFVKLAICLISVLLSPENTQRYLQSVSDYRRKWHRIEQLWNCLDFYVSSEDICFWVFQGLGFWVLWGLGFWVPIVFGQLCVWIELLMAVSVGQRRQFFGSV